MFWSLVKKIDQNKISAEKARSIYEQIMSELDEEQQEILENKISELEEEENYWEISKKMSSKEFYEEEEVDEETLEDQLEEVDLAALEDEDIDE